MQAHMWDPNYQMMMGAGMHMGMGMGGPTQEMMMAAAAAGINPAMMMGNPGMHHFMQ
jgi:hypothetical protein